MSRGATARLFVAVDPPPEVCEALVRWARAATAGMGVAGGRGSMRVLTPASLHLTLCFLGSRPVAEIEPLAGALAECGGRACELLVGAPLWLPPRRPRSLAVEIHDEDGELGRLQRGLANALQEVSEWRPEPRRFRAHVTLARTRGAAGRRSMELLAATPPLSFTAEAVVLYRSHLAREGASYERLADFPLPAPQA